MILAIGLPPLTLKSALFDIEYLANQAIEYGLKLGIATPQLYSGYPLPEEMQIILEEFGDPVFYWHDVGAAQVFDTLGLLPHTIWTDIFAENMIGTHLHDVQGLVSGRPPQKDGDVDFSHIVATLQEIAILNCTFSSKFSQKTFLQATVFSGYVLTLRVKGAFQF